MPLGMIDTQAIRRRWNDVGSKLDERLVRGGGGSRGRAGRPLEAVAKITGYARSTLGRGLKQLDGAPFPAGRVRQPRRIIAPSAVHLAIRPAKDPERRDDMRQAFVQAVKQMDPMDALFLKAIRDMAAKLGSRLVAT
jgi:hypothetical protein